jgi:hypothetical protein
LEADQQRAAEAKGRAVLEKKRAAELLDWTD